MHFRPMPYRPRRIAALEALRHSGWCLKLYGVTVDDDPLDRVAFGRVATLAFAALPRPAVTTARPGVGFLIFHQGMTEDYGVLAWWEHENELFTRVWKRQRGHDATWQPAQDDETACVWDLQVFAGERDAFVDTMLADGGPDVDGYLDRIWSGAVDDRSSAGGDARAAAAPSETDRNVIDSPRDRGTKQATPD